MAGIVAAYFICGKLGLRLTHARTGIMALWPPAGLALSALLIFGDWTWPAIFLGSFFLCLATIGSFMASLSVATGSTLEGLAGLYLISRFAGGRKVFERSLDIFKFAVLAVFLSAAIGATFVATSLSGAGGWVRYTDLWLIKWAGSAMADIIAVPIFLLWSLRPDWGWSRRRSFEMAAIVILSLLTGMLAFGGFLSAALDNYPFDFMCLPILIWTAFRFTQRETATVSGILAALAIRGTLHGFGPFARFDPNEALLLLHVFMGITAGIALMVAATVSQGRRAERALRGDNTALESLVNERTEDLAGMVKKMEAEIARRQRAETSLEQKTEELTRSNEELEQFASVVSHELQEPLRKILVYDELFHEAAAQPEPSAEPYEQRMADAARRMQRLVDKILSLSRVTSKAGRLEMVDLNAVVREIAADFTQRFSEAGGEIKAEPLPSLPADALQMHELFANLISNAYKFRKKNEPPRLSITGRALGKREIEITVQDNGIGFEGGDAERIFLPFERLHRRSEYEGSGLGLTICRRIVERHRGKMTATSAPGKGVAFVITLPR